MTTIKTVLLAWLGGSVLALLSNLAPDGAPIREYPAARIDVYTKDYGDRFQDLMSLKDLAPRMDREARAAAIIQAAAVAPLADALSSIRDGDDQPRAIAFAALKKAGIES